MRLAQGLMRDVGFIEQAVGGLQVAPVPRLGRQAGTRLGGQSGPQAHGPDVAAGVAQVGTAPLLPGPPLPGPPLRVRKIVDIHAHIVHLQDVGKDKALRPGPLTEYIPV